MKLSSVSPLTFVLSAVLLSACGGNPINNDNGDPEEIIKNVIKDTGSKAGKIFRDVGDELQNLVEGLVPCDDYLKNTFEGESVQDAKLVGCFLEITPFGTVLKQECKWYIEKTLDGDIIDEETRRECKIVLITE